MNSSTIINLFHRSRPKKSTLTINLDYSDSIACQPATIIYIYIYTRMLLTYFFLSCIFFFFPQLSSLTLVSIILQHGTADLIIIKTTTFVKNYVKHIHLI